jgi:glycosyltransferase involved in cell wall biosynthesis
MNINYASWICCQLGAREHYAIPRVLFQHNKLARLITDAWVTPRSPLNKLPKSLLSNLRERFHSELDIAFISSFNNSLLEFELLQKIKKNYGWHKIIDRNSWFQNKTVSLLEAKKNKTIDRTTIFAYSYAALDIFKFAKNRGWRTVLGQIDPGSFEEELVTKARNYHLELASAWQPAPSQYWQNWQEECRLADTIIVNSDWSKQALEKTGIKSSKIEIIPLAYNPEPIANNFQRIYPQSFSCDRPLRVLFLGQIILRKGIAAILEAIKLLQDEPIEFWFVGLVGVNLPEDLKNNQKVKFFGKTSRSTTVNYYKQADLFLFPTLSDGFGLTQLEAQAWQLPIIASNFCGTVVKNKINGLILPEVTGNEIAKALIFCLKNPDLLTQFARNANNILPDFSFDRLTKQLNLIN